MTIYQLRTNTDLSGLPTEELDHLACKLASEVDNCEAYGQDFNGEWLTAADKRAHAKWSKLLKMVDFELDLR